VWHKQGVDRDSNRDRGIRPALDKEALDRLALSYVARFATSRGRFEAYLHRKLKERGWDGAEPPDVSAISKRMETLGYIDDSAFAAARARSLAQRGYGPRRLATDLRRAGIGEDLEAATLANCASGEVRAALRFAERRRLGPYAAAAPDPRSRDRALAAFARAGHRFALARGILALAPGTTPDEPALAELR
jgi:regulatory protein